MPTLKQLSEAAILISNKKNLHAFFSDRINNIIGDVSSFQEIYDSNLKINWLNVSFTEADTKGLYLVNPVELLLNGNGSAPFAPYIPANSISVAKMSRLEVLVTRQIGSCPFTGIMEGITTLKRLEISIDTTNDIVIPNLSALPNLTRVVLDGNGLQNYALLKLGNLSNNLRLEYFSVQSSFVPTATVDNILATLLVAKNGGAPLTTVNLSQCGIPTLGANNVSKLALQALGVAVTVRTS